MYILLQSILGLIKSLSLPKLIDNDGLGLIPFGNFPAQLRIVIKALLIGTY